MHWTEKWKELMNKHYTEEGGWHNGNIVFEFAKFVEETEKQQREDFKLYEKFGYDFIKFAEWKEKEAKQ